MTLKESTDLLFDNAIKIVFGDGDLVFDNVKVDTNQSNSDNFYTHIEKTSTKPISPKEKNPLLVELRKAIDKYNRNSAGDHLENVKIAWLRQLKGNATLGDKVTASKEKFVGNKPLSGTQHSDSNAQGPSNINEKKPSNVNAQGPSNINAQRPSNINEKKPSKVNAQRPSNVNAQRPSNINEKKPSNNNAQKPLNGNALPKKDFPVKIVVGSIVGGVLAVILGVFSFLYFKKSSRK